MPECSRPPAGLTALVAHLQQAPCELRWALADQALLRSIANGRPLIRGKWGQRLYGLLSIAAAVNCQWLVVSVAAFCQALAIAFRTRHGAGDRISLQEQHLFVGFGAGAEQELFRRWTEVIESEPAWLDQTDLRSFSRRIPLGFREYLACLADCYRLSRAAIAFLPPGLQVYRLDFLRFIATRLATYAFYRAWFRKFRGRMVSAESWIVFLAADTPAFAAASEGLPCLFYQHGLLFQMLMPDFKRVVALTMDEARWLEQNIPAAQVSLMPVPAGIEQRPPAGPIMIMSIYGAHTYLALVQPFLEWTARRQLHVVVRPHPRESHDFWQKLQADGVRYELEEAQSFAAALQQHTPRLVVSWYSTTLAQALQAGIIPVSVCPLDDINVKDMIYPLFQRALQWPRDAADIEQVLADDVHYQRVLARLTRFAAGSIP